MTARLRRHITFANVCSFLALSIALGTGGAYAANTVFSTDIVDGEVKTPDLNASAVTTGKLRNLGVTEPDLADGAVTGAKVADGSLTADDLGFNSVGSGEIETDAVQASEVADGAIDSGEIAANTLGSIDLATGSVSNAEIVPGAVTNSKLGSNSIDSSKLAANSLTAFDLAGGESNGVISLPAGYVANGRCRDGTIGVNGAEVGDAVIVSINGSVPEAIVLSGVRVPSVNSVTLKTCNLSGAAMAAIDDLHVAVVTITI